MNTLSRIFSICVSIGLLVAIFELVRRKKLKEKYALLWLCTGVTIFTIAVSERLLSMLVTILGVKLPINAVLFLGIFFLVVINLHFSVVISKLSEQNRKIAQKLALLESDKKRS